MSMSYGGLNPGSHQPRLGPPMRQARGPGAWNGVRLAGGWRRLGGIGVDGLIVIIAQEFIPIDPGLVLLVVLALNHVVLQSVTGRSVGKYAVGIHLIRPYPMGKLPARRPLSTDWLAWRLLLHAADVFGFFLAPFCSSSPRSARRSPTPWPGRCASARWKWRR